MQRKYGAALSYLNIIIKNAVTFLYTPFLLNTVGQADYGLFQMTNSVVMSLSLLSMGFSSAYVKFYMEYKVQDNKKAMKKLNGLYILLFSIIGLFAVVIGLILALNTTTLFGNSLTESEIILTKKLMIVLVLNIGLTFPSSVFDANIIVNEQFIFQQTRQIIQSLLVPVISVILILNGFGVLAIGFTQLIVTLIFLILNLDYCLKKLNMEFAFKNLSFNLFKQLAMFSFFILLNQLVDLINNNGPNFVLGMVRGAKDVATFAVALQVKNMFFMLSTSLSSVFVPKVNEIVNKNNDKTVLTALMIKVGRLQMAILFFILGGFIVLGKKFISLWAGPENLDAYWLIIFMVVPSIIPLSQNIGIEIQRAMNKHIFRSIVYSLVAILNIIITFLGTKYLGLFGASLGYIMSIVFANGVLMNWYYQKKMGLHIKEFWFNTAKVTVPFILTTGVLMLIKLYIPINNLFSFFLFAMVYVFMYVFIFIRFSANNFEKSQLLSIVKR
ncbi:lipopolysaccharide biosynthesis protein [Enterococcus faecium]|uniref:lipopolysaccharide biosynthesis protein n=1 Tax=Enterococcus faecium TaxID=1352 RepID=UPI0033910E53